MAFSDRLQQRIDEGKQNATVYINLDKERERENAALALIICVYAFIIFGIVGLFTSFWTTSSNGNLLVGLILAMVCGIILGFFSGPIVRKIAHFMGLRPFQYDNNTPTFKKRKIQFKNLLVYWAIGSILFFLILTFLMLITPAKISPIVTAPTSNNIGAIQTTPIFNEPTEQPDYLQKELQGNATSFTFTYYDVPKMQTTIQDSSMMMTSNNLNLNFSISATCSYSQKEEIIDSISNTINAMPSLKKQYINNNLAKHVESYYGYMQTGDILAGTIYVFDKQKCLRVSISSSHNDYYTDLFNKVMNTLSIN